MTIYQIPSDLRDYHGCGKAWAAVSPSGEILAIRYMGDHFLDWPAMPAWIAAVKRHATGLDECCLPTCRSSKALAIMAAAAQACDDCPKPPRRERYRPTELLTMARAAMTAADSASFSAYRERCRAELADLGEVISGMCSCYHFIGR